MDFECIAITSIRYPFGANPLVVILTVHNDPLDFRHVTDLTPIAPRPKRVRVLQRRVNTHPLNLLVCDLEAAEAVH